MGKLLVGLLLVLFSTYIGYFLARKYRQRRLFYGEWLSFTSYFLEELSYLKRPVIEFLSARRYKGEFQMVVEEIARSIKEDRGFVLEGFLPFLKGEEIENLKTYFYEMGKGDTASQKAFFSAQKERVEERQKESEMLCKKYGDLYVKLGLLCGLALLLLIV